MRSMRGGMSTQSLASLLVEPDEYIILSQMKQVLDTMPSRRPPLEPTELLPHLMMGSQRNAGDIYTLQEMGVTHVLNCAGLKPSAAQRNPYPRDSGVTQYLCIPAEDQPNYDIGQHFEKAIEFINSSKSTGGRVLVHCNLGINRSGAICAAYMVFNQFMPLLDVVHYLKQRRGLVLCNKGFRRQLIKFARLRNLPITTVSDPSNTLLHSISKHMPADTISLPGFLRDEENGWDATSSAHPENGTTEGQLKPQRFATAYCTLPRKSGSSPFRAGKRQVSASHYEKEYFMDAIPEDRPAHKFVPDSRRGLSFDHEFPPATRRMSSFGNLSFSAFRKLKSKSVQNDVATHTPSLTSLSTTRPLKVYRRSVTDSEIYGKPSAQYFYKRADTVATCDATAGLQALNISDKVQRKPEKKKDESDNKKSQQKGTSGFFRRFRSEKK